MSGSGSVDKRVEKVKEVFEAFAREYVNLLNDFATKETELRESHYPYGCERCKRGCDEEQEKKCEKELLDLLNRLDDERGFRTADLYNEVEEKLKKLGFDEVEFNVATESNCYFNLPAWPRAYNYYRVHEYNHVVDKKAKKCYVVEVKYSELQKPWRTEYAEPEVEIEEGAYFDEDVPFSNALFDRIPWTAMRPEWIHHIEEFVKRIVEAERAGRLAEEVKKIYAEAKRGAWVYDYAHFLDALEETCKKFNIDLRG
jgi:hypothetical protein